MTLRRTSLVLLGSILAMSACGDDDTPSADGGGLPDGPIGGPTLPTCDAPLHVAPMEGEEVTLELDTSDGAPGALDLGACGGTERLPQVVIEYVVPGAGPHRVDVSTNRMGTPADFDTVVSVRHTACDCPDDSAFPPSCFDDVSATERRSEGSFPAAGGETVWIVVTGFFEDDRGPVELALTGTAISRPVLQEATARVVSGMLEVAIVGEDADGDAKSVRVSLFDETRALVDADGDGRVTPGDILTADLDMPVTGAVRFDERATIPISNGGMARLALVSLVDEANAVSDPIETVVQTGTLVGFMEACDGMATVCDRELACTTMLCAPTPARAAACAAAPSLTVVAPGATTTTGSTMGVLMPGGTSLFRGPCSSTSGPEQFYSVVVPATPAVDLVLTTDAPGTAAGSDTVLYVRSNCPDPTSAMESWCDDDGGTDLLSRLEIRDAAPGTYTVFVEAYGGLDAGEMLRYELQASLRPVLPMGAACDPDEVSNRCAAGPCSVVTRVCD